MGSATLFYTKTCNIKSPVTAKADYGNRSVNIVETFITNVQFQEQSVFS